MFRNLLIGVALVGLSIGGSFVAGLNVGKQSAPATAAGLSANALGAPGGTGQQIVFAATVGTISRVEGKTVYVKGPDGKETTVNLTDQTQVEKQVKGTTADLQVGSRVAVRPQGQPAGDGAVTAASISLMPEGTEMTMPIRQGAGQPPTGR